VFICRCEFNQHWLLLHVYAQMLIVISTMNIDQCLYVDVVDIGACQYLFDI